MSKILTALLNILGRGRRSTLQWSTLWARALMALPKHTVAGLLNKSSCLAPALGVTKLIIVLDMILVTLCCASQV